MFVEKACGTCHTVDGLEGATGVVGPKLNGIATRGASRRPGMTGEEYIRESIENPAAFVVDGCANLMLPLRGAMTDEEFETLVEYLLTLVDGSSEATCP